MHKIFLAGCVILSLFFSAPVQADVELVLKDHYELNGNFVTPQRLFDACTGLMNRLGYNKGTKDYACGSVADPYDPQRYHHKTAGWYFDWAGSNGDIAWYINAWACENNEYVRYFPDSGQCATIVKIGPVPSDPKDNGRPCPQTQPTCGNPVKMGSGSKVQFELDYIDQGPGGLSISRTYNGGAYGIFSSVDFGKQWSFMSYGRIIKNNNKPQTTCYYRIDTWRIFCDQLSANSTDASISAIRPDGKMLLFTERSDGVWTADADIAETLTAFHDPDDTEASGWILKTPSGAIERYDSKGLLVSIDRVYGGNLHFTYGDGLTNDSAQTRFPSTAPICKNVSGATIAALNQLLCVTDNWGRQLNFEYNIQGKVSRIINPDGEIYQYGYDGATGRCSEINGSKFCSGNLTSVTYPDGKIRYYHYTEDSLTSYGSCQNYGRLYNSLTGITDENGARFASWGYQCDGSAISSEHAGGVEKVKISYGAFDSVGARNVSVTSYGGTVQNPTTAVRKYHFSLILGVAKNDSVDIQCDNCGDFAFRTYDGRGNVATATDWVGKKTIFTYEANRNLEIKRVEAGNTDFARTISTIWHPDFLQPSQVWEPNRVTNYSYDARGRTLTRVEQATNDPSGSRGSSAAVIGKRRVWSYLYNSSGQVIKLTGPRTDVADITNYAYDGEGNLATIVNPLGHTTNFSNYDRSGRPGRIVKANGITVEMTYWPRGWLKRSSITASGRTETTEYVYDGVGQLKLVTLADSSTVGYDYDDAHRLTRVTDSLGNKISYSYDLASNRISEEVSDSSNILARKIARVYDALNLLKQQTGGTQ